MATAQEAEIHVKDTPSVPMPKSGTYLRRAQVEELQGEAAGMEKMLSDPLLSKRIEDAAGMQSRISDVKQMLAEQAPPRLTPEQRDMSARREGELKEKIRDSMCSQEEMRKSPPGAIGKFRNGEASPAIKSLIVEWKNHRLMLNPENSDPDLCNIEKFRPRTSTIPMDGAFIPGKSHHVAPGTPESIANWERTFGGTKPENGEGDEIAALRAEMAEMRAQIEASKVDRPSEEKGVAKPRKPSSKTVTMACGKVMGNRGQRMHRLHCKNGCEPEE